MDMQNFDEETIWRWDRLIYNLYRDGKLSESEYAQQRSCWRTVHQSIVSTPPENDPLWQY